MKNILSLMLITLLFISNQTSSQSINNVPLRDINQKYIELVVSYNQQGAFAGYTLDLGKDNRNFNGRDLVLRDQNSMVLKYNSVVDILNFFDKNGFILYQTYMIPAMQGSQSFGHYLLTRNR